MKQLYAVVDLETTGPKFEAGDRIIQIGCTLIEEDRIVGEYVFDVNPARSIPTAITQLTGITTAQVANAPYFEDIALTLYALLERAVFVAHNVRFDYAFLVKSFATLANMNYEANVIDTVQLTQILYPTFESFRLQDIAKTLQLEHEQAHHAGADANVTAQLFIMLIGKIRSLPLSTLESFLPFTEALIGQTGLLFSSLLTQMRAQKPVLADDLMLVEGIAFQKTIAPLDSYTHYRQSEEVDSVKLYQQLINHQHIERRQAQEKLIEIISNFLVSSDSHLLIEASSGMGKTLGYLLPLVQCECSHQQIWISVPTIALQQQLIENEVRPLLQRLNRTLPIVSLKSSRHYLDLAKWKSFLTKKTIVSQREAIAMMGVAVWLTQTQTGDVTECNQNIIYPELLHDIQQCDQTAYKKAFEPYNFYSLLSQQVPLANIVITNHAFLWTQLKGEPANFLQSGKQEKYVLLDECHQWERSLFDSERLDIHFRLFHLFETLIHQYMVEQMTQFGEIKLTPFQTIIDQFMRCVFYYQQMVESLATKEVHTFTATEWVQSSAIDQCTQLYDELVYLDGQIDEVMTKNNETASIDFIERLQNYIKKLLLQLEQLFDLRSTDMVAIAVTNENEQQDITITIVPFVYDWLDPLQRSFQKIIGISATLPLTSPFWQNELPSFNVQTIQNDESWYRGVTFLFPTDLLTPNYENVQPYLNHLAEAIATIYQQKRGKVLVLVHSVQALEVIRAYLVKKIPIEAGAILAQGINGSARKVAKRFAEVDNGLLLGLYSFWEGFDRQNDPIETVIMTKLPFPNIQSIEQQLLKKFMTQQDKSYFQQYALLQMLLHFKQGIGRLIRAHKQTGSIWVLDSRAMSKSYHHKIVSLIPSQARVIKGPLTQCLEVQ